MSRPKGSTLSIEHRKKIGISNKGKKRAPMLVEYRKKISESVKRNGPKGNALRLSDETIRRKEFEKKHPNSGYCEICYTERKKLKSELHLDHDHSNGRYRGWLCRDCNLALGHVKDDVSILYAMINYLSVDK